MDAAQSTYSVPFDFIDPAIATGWLGGEGGEHRLYLGWYCRLLDARQIGQAQRRDIICDFVLSAAT